MATIIQRTARGRRKTLTKLYEANKQDVCFLSGLLLKEAEAAEIATVWAFKNSWRAVINREIDSEEMFSSF